MAITVDVDNKQTIELDEYVDYVNRNVDVYDTDSVCESAGKFKELLNNKSLVIDVIKDELRRWETSQASNYYTGQTFLLARGDDFFVRANMWLPAASQDGAVQEWEANMYAYLLAHDHNFSFMTGGYHGGGYETDIYEYDNRSISGTPGEAVEMKFLERTTLHEGKIMYYRASTDIHRQFHPGEFSISLNLMVRPKHAPTQYVFNIEESKIDHPITMANGGNQMMCKLAAYFPDPQVTSMLETIANRHVDPHVRAAAFESLIEINPSDRDEIFAVAARDKAPLVRALATAP